MEDQLAIVFRVFDKLVVLLIASLLILNITFHCSQVRSATSLNKFALYCTLNVNKIVSVYFTVVFCG